MPFEPRSITETGVPYFQVQTFTRSGRENGVEISIGVSTESIVFARNGDRYEAACEIVCRVLNQETEKVIREVAWVDTLQTTEYNRTQSREVRYMSRFVPLEPGSYVVEATLTDRNSGKTAVRLRRTRVADATGNGPGVAGIEIRFRDQRGRSVPLLGLYLDRTAGTVDCSSEVNNLLPGDSVVAIVEVLQGERDTSLPAVPYSFAPLHGSLDYSGMSFSDPVTRLVDTVAFTHPPQSVLEWQFSAGEEGLYLIRVEGTVYHKGSIPEPLVQATRPLVVVSRGFPRPSELDRLLGPLEYIMVDAERDSLQTKKTEATGRSFMETFWKSVGKNEEAASNVIEQYYARVEEANEYFSSFCEGWRTDRGMIYIVLGPPFSVQTGLQGEVWNYSYVEGDRLNSYSFRSVSLPEEFQSFEHLLLERQPYYDQGWFAAIDRWRRGSGY